MMVPARSRVGRRETRREWSGIRARLPLVLQRTKQPDVLVRSAGFSDVRPYGQMLPISRGFRNEERKKEKTPLRNHSPNTLQPTRTQAPAPARAATIHPTRRA